MTSWNRMSPKPGINPDNPLNPISPPPCRGRAREGVESQISRRANPHPNLPPTKGKGRFGANDLSGIKGLYAITPDSSDTADLLRRTRLVLSGGARVLQYRNKSANAVLRLTQATALRELTREFGVTFILNDDAYLAARVDADGVHLGATDGELKTARAILGKHKIIGVSCYNRLALAQEAVAVGADYVAFGAFFPSTVKPDAVTADVELLRQARAALAVPLVAIGGITAQNAAVLINAGADALAVISALFDVVDSQAAAQNFSRFFIRDSAS